MEVEYGSVQPVGFATGKMYDSCGVEMKCKCGKASGSAIMGKAAFVAYCQDCNPNKAFAAEFVYRDPNYQGMAVHNAIPPGKIHEDNKT